MRQTAFSLLLAGAGSASAALQVDFSSPDSIKTAAKTVASDMMTYYKGNESGNIPGILSQPPPGGDYYWWHGAVVWSTLIDYWRYTGDETYNDVTKEGLLWQTGPNNNFMPPNWTAQLGNDDQATWALAAMSAAESNFTSPSAGETSWLQLAQNVFATQAARFDETCGGGLRWQIPHSNLGYTYKNSPSNTAFIALAARLSRYTGNQTYAEAAESTWTWMTNVGLIDDAFNVFDGAHVETNCTDTNKVQFSISAGHLLQGAAYLYNSSTGDAQTRWRDRLSSLTNRTLEFFFPNDFPLVERGCELEDRDMCSVDMQFFKGIVIRELATVIQLAPFLNSAIAPKLKLSAEGAVKSCSGGANGRLCGYRWFKQSAPDSSAGNSTFPRQANALSALSVLLADDSQKGIATGGGDGGNGNGNGNGGGNNNGAGNGSNNNNNNNNGGNDGSSAGTTTRATFGLLVAGLFASLL